MIYWFLLTIATCLPLKQWIFQYGDVSDFLHRVDRILSDNEYTLQEASWKYETNITDYNQEQATKVQLQYNQVLMQILEESKLYKGGTADEQRQLKLLWLKSGTPSNLEDQKKISELQAKMTAIYSTAEVDGMSLDPELTELMATSRDYDKLLHAYIGWRNATGPKVKSIYKEFIDALNIGAKENGFGDVGKLWRSDYDMNVDDFTMMVEKVWQKVFPLYEQLHCYTREKLKQVYGQHYFDEDGYIPAHLLGNMWSQEWGNLYDILIPFPDATPVELTPELKRQGYTAERMHRTSESFYQSLGYDALPDTFWTKSMLVKPQDRDAVCHASAWDFGKNDLRIKMCTNINGEDLLTIHHEQGHLYYDHYYRFQHILYRESAADFFHEAIGDTMQLSVVTPQHLSKIGLIQGPVKDSPELVINAQMAVALSKIAILPWSYLVDLWRWKVMGGEVDIDHYQDYWIKLVEHYQGLKRPVQSTRGDFDAGSKFHVPSNTPYIRYFGAAIIQFQFHEALCEAAGHKGPMHTCDIYQNLKAGEQFKQMLSLGKSKPWMEALKAATNGKFDTLDGSSLIKYFEPLLNWLQEENKGKQCGWKKQL